ncbi:hypothetical protein EXW94_11205 [Enterobacter sp. JMULE2]|uniref:hypothetical protein n=1 Tax=Enterobacter sp. JMULE2 TaxID=2518340 RepID=UPI0015770B11|nr:hypothetical protein [Enterobacter sp. JMULE2]NTZ38306.1 hypothetical protein [Enterobacter sp. JMULE2]
MDENELHRNHWCEWSAADLTFLEVNYRTMPLPELARILGRTPGSVRLMAHKLACQEKASPRWTAEEDDIIRQHYASGAGAAFIATLLKDRTSSAVFTRADTLGVTSGRYWREEERRILKEHYPAIGSGVLNLLPGRTPEAIKIIAGRMGLRKSSSSREGFRPWSDAEWRLLEENIHLSIAEQQATLFPDRTKRAVEKARERLLKKKRALCRELKA